MRAVAIVVAVALTVALVHAEPQASSQAPQARDPYDEALDRAEEYAGQGLVDKAVLLLDDTGDRALAAGARERAAACFLAAAGLYRELGNGQAFLDRLSKAAQAAAGTPLEATMESHLQLALAQVSLDRDDVEAALESLGDVFTRIAGIADADRRRNLESTALTLRVRIELAVAASDQLDVPASSLPADAQRTLDVLLSDDLTRTPSRSRADAARLERQKPWKERLLQVALSVNNRVTVLDGGYSDERLRNLEVAKDKSDRGTILAELGRVDEAIAIKKETLAVFDRYNVVADSLVDLDHLCDLLIQKGVPNEALPYSLELIGRIESQTFVQVGQTTVDYLQMYEGAYQRHARLLWTQYLVLKKLNNGSADAALNAFLIHADRERFRGPRRDMAVYHDLGALLGADAGMVTRLEAALSRVTQAQAQVDQAVVDQKTPADFEPAPGIVVNSPFRAVAEAREDFITAIENIKRKETRSIGVDPTITARMPNVVDGMGANDGILMYFHSPEGIVRGAVITSAGTQMVELGTGVDEEVAMLAARLQQHVAVDPDAILTRLSTLLLGKLPDLPRRVTVVLSDAIMGVPFEALTKGGQLVASGHDIRYAFGLYPRVGARTPAVPIRRAMIVGAETFIDNAADSLPQSREEVEDIRAWLRRLNVTVAPANALPQTGRALLSDAEPYQVIHLSTHSRLDGAVPMLDSLLFPRDRVYAHQLALSALRASLVVLSACELYRPRGDRLYPVSGVTSAALGRIAPLVISPMWEVNATATRLFMLRFYSALVDSGDAVVALGETKRDFASGALRNWLESSKVGINVSAADIAEYRRPYYWAAFALAIGVSGESPSR